MKNKIIKFIKKQPFLYNLAKKVNRKFKKIPPKQEYTSNTVYYTYEMQQRDELEKIKEHYKKVRNTTSQLLVVINNKELSLQMHKLIRENLSVLFADLNYFKEYQAKLQPNKFVLMDYKQENIELLKYM